MKPTKLTDFQKRTLERLVGTGSVRARDCNGVTKQCLNQLVKKGLVRRFKGAFGEDEWKAVRPPPPEFPAGYMQGRGAA